MGKKENYREISQYLCANLTIDRLGVAIMQAVFIDSLIIKPG
jgi:hypothetical protein